MTRRYPEHDFSTMLVHGVPWNEIATKIGFMRGSYLTLFWERRSKYHTEDGKLKFAKTSKPPDKVILMSHLPISCLTVLSKNNTIVGN